VNRLIVVNVRKETCVYSIVQRALAPRSTHVEHLHAGTYGSNGAVKLSLATLTANVRGYAVAATFIPRMASLTGLALNAHAINRHPVARGTLIGIMPL